MQIEFTPSKENKKTLSPLDGRKLSRKYKTHFPATTSLSFFAREREKDCLVPPTTIYPSPYYGEGEEEGRNTPGAKDHAVAAAAESAAA